VRGGALRDVLPVLGRQQPAHVALRAAHVVEQRGLDQRPVLGVHLLKPAFQDLGRAGLPELAGAGLVDRAVGQPAPHLILQIGQVVDHARLRGNRLHPSRLAFARLALGLLLRQLPAPLSLLARELGLRIGHPAGRHPLGLRRDAGAECARIHRDRLLRPRDHAAQGHVGLSVRNACHQRPANVLSPSRNGE